MFPYISSKQTIWYFPTMRYISMDWPLLPDITMLNLIMISFCLISLTLTTYSTWVSFGKNLYKHSIHQYQILPKLQIVCHKSAVSLMIMTFGFGKGQVYDIPQDVRIFMVFRSFYHKLGWYMKLRLSSHIYIWWDLFEMFYIH